ncbi:MAG: diaminopimelate decarboxylase, partial [Candidatus Latescibacteria bacterium]|nr:diaminopimelate decarboxylase [Candidatus Latescibacterota bacterium]
MEQLLFLDEDQVREIRAKYGSPVYVYDQRTLEAQAEAVLNFPNAFGLTARYAMKALPNSAVIRILTKKGLHIDASSGYEAERAMRAGVPGDHIQLTAQQVPDNLGELVEKGVIYNACSLNQLRRYGELFPGRTISVRINPGMGSGHSNRTNVGGPAASFGIWHEHIDEVQAICKQHHLTVTTMHTHIGSGSDPEVWERVAVVSLEICVGFEEATTLSLGGGYKVGRMQGEVSTDLQVIGGHVVEAFRMTEGKTGRALRLEVEPGTYLVANAGAIVATVIDVVDTGEDGYTFIKTDSGMTEVIRPSMYGAQHPIVVVPAEAEERG